jgi:two-component system phosphate regulon response regulator PhoB
MTDDSAVTKSRKARILLVEDDKVVRTSLALMLQSRGFEVHQTEDAAGGFLKAMTTHPDLVVLDIILPVRSGFALCKKLKKSERCRDIPIILLSALPEKQQRKESNWKGPPAADDFVTKPYKPQDLLERIDRLIAAKPRNPASPK